MSTSQSVDSTHVQAVYQKWALLEAAVYLTVLAGMQALKCNVRIPIKYVEFWFSSVKGNETDSMKNDCVHLANAILSVHQRMATPVVADESNYQVPPASNIA